MHLTFVVDPGHPEHVHTLGLHEPFYDLCLLKLRVLIVHILNRDEHFFHCLQKLRLMAVFPFKAFQNLFNFHSRFVF